MAFVLNVNILGETKAEIIYHLGDVIQAINRGILDAKESESIPEDHIRFTLQEYEIAD